jgi:hypothetical protein
LKSSALLKKKENELQQQPKELNSPQNPLTFEELQTDPDNFFFSDHFSK